MSKFIEKVYYNAPWWDDVCNDFLKVVENCLKEAYHSIPDVTIHSSRGEKGKEYSCYFTLSPSDYKFFPRSFIKKALKEKYPDKNIKIRSFIHPYLTDGDYEITIYLERAKMKESTIRDYYDNFEKNHPDDADFYGPIVKELLYDHPLYKKVFDKAKELGYKVRRTCFLDGRGGTEDSMSISIPSFDEKKFPKDLGDFIESLGLVHYGKKHRGASGYIFKFELFEKNRWPEEKMKEKRVLPEDYYDGLFEYLVKMYSGSDKSMRDIWLDISFEYGDYDLANDVIKELKKGMNMKESYGPEPVIWNKKLYNYIKECASDAVNSYIDENDITLYDDEFDHVVEYITNLFWENEDRDEGKKAVMDALEDPDIFDANIPFAIEEVAGKHVMDDPIGTRDYLLRKEECCPLDKEEMFILQDLIQRYGKPDVFEESKTKEEIVLTPEQEDVLWNIANRYCTSVPVSGSWETETEHQINTIMNTFGISRKQAISCMKKYLGWTDEDLRYNHVKLGESKLREAGEKQMKESTWTVEIYNPRTGKTIEKKSGFGSDYAACEYGDHTLEDLEEQGIEADYDTFQESNKDSIKIGNVVKYDGKSYIVKQKVGNNITIQGHGRAITLSPDRVEKIFDESKIKESDHFSDSEREIYDIKANHEFGLVTCKIKDDWGVSRYFLKGFVNGVPKFTNDGNEAHTYSNNLALEKAADKVKQYCASQESKLKEAKDFDLDAFEAMVPHNMRYKHWEDCGDLLYWVTQDDFDEEDLEEFKRALATTNFKRAYVIVRDYSHYDRKEDFERDLGYFVEAPKSFKSRMKEADEAQIDFDLKNKRLSLKDAKALKNIDLKINSEDYALFVEEMKDHLDLDDIKEVEYAEPIKDFDGAYKVTLKDGAVKYFDWKDFVGGVVLREGIKKVVSSDKAKEILEKLFQNTKEIFKDEIKSSEININFNEETGEISLHEVTVWENSDWPIVTDVDYNTITGEYNWESKADYPRDYDGSNGVPFQADGEGEGFGQLLEDLADELGIRGIEEYVSLDPSYSGKYKESKSLKESDMFKYSIILQGKEEDLSKYEEVLDRGLALPDVAYEDYYFTFDDATHLRVSFKNAKDARNFEKEMSESEWPFICFRAKLSMPKSDYKSLKKTPVNVSRKMKKHFGDDADYEEDVEFVSDPDTGRVWYEKNTGKKHQLKESEKLPYNYTVKVFPGEDTDVMFDVLPDILQEYDGDAVYGYCGPYCFYVNFENKEDAEAFIPRVDHSNIKVEISFKEKKEIALNENYTLFRKFEKNIPHSMRYKHYEVIDDILYWITQEPFDEFDITHFVDAMEDLLPYKKALVICRDYSTYNFEKDKASEMSTKIDLNK